MSFGRINQQIFSGVGIENGAQLQSRENVKENHRKSIGAGANCTGIIL
jgi:hypothetical protein